MIIHIVETILEILTGDDHPYPRPYEQPYKFIKRLRAFEKNQYNSAVRKMQKRGVIKITIKNNQKFIQSTRKGQIQILLKKAAIQKPKTWDGKWRLVVFDIPESNRDKRSLLRDLLKKNGFYKLQASVFIHPFPLNRAAISYLKESKLVDFIRILKVEELDDDKDLKKKFNL